MNYRGTEKLYEKYPNLTNILPFSNNKYYNEIYKNIEENFIRAKNSKADYIVVLAHMGT